MNRPTILVPWLAWLVIACLWTVPNAESADLIFKDPQYSFQTLRAVGYSVSEGADVGEVLKTAYAIEAGDDESWYTQWLKTAERCESNGREFLASGSTVAARREFLKASNYYRTAEFFLHIHPDDPRILSTWKKSRDAFLKAAELSPRPIVPLKIPYEDTTLPGYLCLADESGVKRPLLIVHTGFDGTKEELYLETACFAVERGYNVLLFEGPGQGEVIRVQKLPFRPDWENVVRPVVDFALTLKEVDTKRIALMGISLGGYLAPRAAAYEKRIMACIANGGVYDFHTAANLSPEQEKYLDIPQAAEAMDKEIAKRMESDPSLRWAMGNGMFTFHAKSPTEWLRMTRAYNMREAAPKISCPTLVVDSAGDRDMPGQAKKLYAALTCPRDYLLFTKEDGAEEHCQMGAMLISNARILDWLDDVMTASRSEGRESLMNAERR